MFKKDENNNAVVVKLRNVRPHPNADRLQLANALGETVVVGLDAKEEDLMIYFDSNLCLSAEYLSSNNLYSTANLNKDTSKKGYFGKKGRVKAQTFRGEKSYGYVADIYSLNSLARVKESDMVEGLEFNEVAGIKICEKYVSELAKKKIASKGKRSNLGVKSNMFPQHWQTKQFKRKLEDIPSDRMIYIEEKYHGTSARIAKVKYKRELSYVEKVLKYFNFPVVEDDWLLMNGTRRVDLTRNPKANTFYKGDMRQLTFDKYAHLLHKNEQAYFEICGYDSNGSWIQKGFPYGCEDYKHVSILYRITFNTEEGRVLDLSREYVYRRAEELGMEKPHLFEKYHYTGDIDELVKKVESYTDGQSTMDSNTMREGVVIWFENNEGKWTCLKNKSFDFLERESKAKDKDDYVDVEEEN